MLLLTKVKQVFKLIKDKKEIGVTLLAVISLYYMLMAALKSKILSLKYPHLQLLIQTSRFYMGSWHKLLKSKHDYFLTSLFIESQFGDDDAAGICVIMVSFCVRNFNV